MIVMKFGGTSVGNAERIQDVARLVSGYLDEKPVVVTSAMTQVTNQLEEMARLAVLPNRKRAISTRLNHLREGHDAAISALGLKQDAATELHNLIDTKLSILENILKSVTALGELTPRGRDLILSFGERLSIHLVSAALNNIGVPAQPVNATSFLLTDDSFNLSWHPPKRELKNAYSL